MKTALALFLALAIPACGAHYVSREYQFRAKNERGQARRVYLRITCKKGADGKEGLVNSVEATIVDVFVGNVTDRVSTFFRDICPSPAEALADLSDDIDLTTVSPVPQPDARAAAIPTVTSPAEHRAYVANLTGSNGDSQIDVMNTETRQLFTSIDFGDRLFGGLRLSSDGRRLYALMWPQTLGTFLPAQIAYIDTATNTIVDRFDLPGLFEPRAPALAADGRTLYFAAREGELGPSRLRAVDLVRKTIDVLPAPGFPNVNLLAASLSPDGELLCAVDTGAVYCYDTRTRTFLGRAIVSLPNVDLRPVFHPDGSKMYFLLRTTVDGALSFFISVVDTGELREIKRIPIVTPTASAFRPTVTQLSIDPTGLRLVLDEGVNGVLNIIDTRTNRVVKTTEGLTTGGLGGAIVKP